MTDHDLAILKASTTKRVEVTCLDGEIVVGELVMVSAEDVLLDAVVQPDGTESSSSVLSVGLSEIASVRVIDSK